MELRPDEAAGGKADGGGDAAEVVVLRRRDRGKYKSASSSSWPLHPAKPQPGSDLLILAALYEHLILQ